jgi:hypothetical protein
MPDFSLPCSSLTDALGVTPGQIDELLEPFVAERAGRSEFVKQCTSCAFLAIAESGTRPDSLPPIPGRPESLNVTSSQANG